MTHQAGRRAQALGGLAMVLAAGALLPAALSGCGDDGKAERTQLVREARGYAARALSITETTRAQLGVAVEQADYRDGAAAAASTRAYAAAVRSAATALGRLTPPASVATRHRGLVDLYRSTAERLEALAAQFTAVSSERELRGVAQQLSGEVQALSTKEAELRAGIERALAVTTQTTPERSTAPGPASAPAGDG